VDCFQHVVPPRKLGGFAIPFGPGGSFLDKAEKRLISFSWRANPLSSQSPDGIDLSTLKPLLDELQRRLREDENLDELAAWQKAFRKTVPLFARSVVAGYLLRQWAGKSSVRRKMPITTVFVSVGKNRRVFPRDLVALFTTTGALEKLDIGEIKIFDNYSFVEVQENSAAELIGRLEGTTFRGRRLTVNFAKKRASGEADFKQWSSEAGSTEEER